VKPDATVYDVRLINSDSGWKWDGTVSADGTVNETSPLKQITEEESRQISEEFVKKSPTFIFDGMDGTLKLVDTVVLRTPFGWTYTYSFQSAHGGYGDRTGQQVLQAITPHTAEVTVIRGEVINAVMDGQWDMVNQKMNVDVVEEPSRKLAEDFIKDSPTFKFDGIDGSIEWVETLYLTPDDSRALVFIKFQSTHAGYGDRTGQVVAEVITRHDVQVTIDNGRVESAVMDGQWDMVNQVTTSDDGPGVVPPLDDGTTSVQLGLTFDQMSGLNHIVRDVSVELPGSLIVTLDSNPTTGYQWQEARIGDESVLSQYSRQFVEPETGAIGAPGKDVWTFKSLERGTSTLQFKYCRPWAGGEENEWIVELNVTVK
jgi:predicted secreted protein